MKLITITWSYSDKSEVKESILYKSFIKNNNDSDFINFHFNRSNYLDLEKKFELQYGVQYDYILYKIFLLQDLIETIDDDILIFSDTNDVVCVGSIDQILYEDGIIFSVEKHQYPNDITSWKPVFSYSDKNIIERNFLNSGLLISEKKLYIQLLYSVIEKVLPLNYKSFGGDQGVYIYHFINEFLPKISLDENRNIFVSTYLTSYDWYTFENGKLLYRPTNSYPTFVHDNGWNYGSPKIIERYRLI
jgi:hypothetical protein